MCRVRPEVEGITRRRAYTRQLEQIVGLPLAMPSMDGLTKM